jgi:hypothetical protein
MIEFNVLVARGTMTEPNDANSMLDMFGEVVQGRWWHCPLERIRIDGSMGGGKVKTKTLALNFLIYF